MPQNPEQTFEIEGPNFMAGVVVVAGRVIDAAPIVKEFKGKRWSEAERLCRHRGWKVRLIATSIPSSGPKPNEGTTPPA